MKNILIVTIILLKICTMHCNLTTKANIYTIKRKITKSGFNVENTSKVKSTSSLKTTMIPDPDKTKSYTEKNEIFTDSYEIHIERTKQFIRKKGSTVQQLGNFTKKSVQTTSKSTHTTLLFASTGKTEFFKGKIDQPERTEIYDVKKYKSTDNISSFTKKVELFTKKQEFTTNEIWFNSTSNKIKENSIKMGTSSNVMKHTTNSESMKSNQEISRNISLKTNIFINPDKNDTFTMNKIGDKIKDIIENVTNEEKSNQIFLERVDRVLEKIKIVKENENTTTDKNLLMKNKVNDTKNKSQMNKQVEKLTRIKIKIDKNKLNKSLNNVMEESKSKTDINMYDLAENFTDPTEDYFTVDVESLSKNISYMKAFLEPAISCLKCSGMNTGCHSLSGEVKKETCVSAICATHFTMRHFVDHDAPNIIRYCYIRDLTTCDLLMKNVRAIDKTCYTETCDWDSCNDQIYDERTIRRKARKGISMATKLSNSQTNIISIRFLYVLICIFVLITNYF